jgi:hypothetical protein
MTVTDGGPETHEAEVSEAAVQLARMVTFNLDSLEWRQIVMRPDTPQRYLPETVEGKVDFEKFYAQGMWISWIDAGGFNILGVKLAPNFTIPRHHHNVHQLVFVHEGEVWQGNRCYHPGDAYFTRAYHPYSVTAGPEGSVSFEIRMGPQAALTLETHWDEADPAKWVHGRRPGGPASNKQPVSA